MSLIKKNAVILRSIWAVTLLTLISIWIFLFVLFKAYEKDLVEGKRQELVQMNNVVTQHTHALFKSIETDLRVMVLWLETQHGKNPAADPRFIELVTRLEKNSNGLIDVRLVTPNGDAYAVPPTTKRPFANISDRDYFKEMVYRDADEVRLGVPIIARLTGRWIIPVSYRMPADVSGFRFIVVAVDLDKLNKVQEHWRISQHGSIVLMREDGTLLSRAPFDQNLIGKKFTATPGYKERQRKPQGTYFADSAASDHVKRIVSYEHLGEFRMFVLVTRGYDEALHAFYKIRTYASLAAVILSLFMLAAALAMHKAQKTLQKVQQSYQRLALVDDLTTVMNRRAFMSSAENELSMARMRGGRIAALMIDIDHFKSINDRFGHAVGDEVLKFAATLWRGALRRQDLLGRLGGEEFCVVLPTADMELVCEAAERLRLLTEQKSAIGPESISFTISIGVAALDDSTDDIPALLKKADEALYLAKKNGRNRVEVYSSNHIA